MIDNLLDDSKMRVAMFFKTKRASEMLMEIYKESEGKYFNKKDYLDLDLKMDSLRMLIANYLVALLGQGKFDKMSIYNNKEIYNTPIIESFYKDNETGLQNLVETRNKVFAHFDNQAYDELPIVYFDFIEKCLLFLESILIRGGK